MNAIYSLRHANLKKPESQVIANFTLKKSCLKQNSPSSVTKMHNTMEKIALKKLYSADL